MEHTEFSDALSTFKVLCATHETSSQIGPLIESDEMQQLIAIGRKKVDLALGMLLHEVNQDKDSSLIIPYFHYLVSQIAPSVTYEMNIKPGDTDNAVDQTKLRVIYYLNLH